VDPRKSVAEAVVRSESALNYFSFAREELAHVRQNERALTLGLGDADVPSGALLIAYPVEREPSSETLRLCIEIAASFVALAAADGLEAERDSITLRGPSWWRLPRGVEWKARTLGVLNRRMLARARFVDRALRSVEDGIIVASVEGRIAFVNPRAADILGAPEHALIGSDLFERIGENERGSSAFDELRLNRAKRETLVRLIVARAPVEREITISEAPSRYYMLRLSAVCDGDEGTGAVLGIVASLSDITKQRDLQQMKNDVMALVSHELRTPLTAIQGMSEVLAQFEVDADRRREMHLAINDEAKRLARMIDDYLDITRLESGARPLRLTPVRVAPLIERALLMLDPIAAQREIRILRRFAPNLPALLADADLIAQAVTNLVANAIKYSPCKTEVFVEARQDFEALWIEVIDHGYGIPSDVTGRIFEKFYRVPRIEDADVPGTGLGLAFVREIAEMHGGRITVESEPGVGSTFSLRLPLQPKGR
jgi:PAS domain S-box-containing protein